MLNEIKQLREKFFMKAVLLSETGGPEKLRVRDMETPQPGPDEVRVKLHASALNRRDYWMTLGLYPRMQLPCVPGSDGAGVVDAVGEGVDNTLIGREVILYPARQWGEREDRFGPDFRVLGMPDQGTFAEMICAPAGDIYPKPVHLDREQAAAVPLAGLTAWRAVVTQGEVKPGYKVLVTGAGSGVSSFAILWSVALGAEVYVSSGSEEKIRKAKELGVVDGLNYTDADCYRELKNKSGGFDVIIDSAGGEALQALLDTLNPAGRYVFFGATLGSPARAVAMAGLFFRHIRIQGTTMGSPREFAAMLDFLDKNRIEPVIGEVFPLTEIVKAVTLMKDYRQTGKIVLRNF